MIKTCISIDPVVAAAKIPMMCDLWMQWAVEMGQTEADPGHWARKLLKGILDQNMVMVLLTEDEVPIGMATVEYGIEPGHGRIRALADKLYVVPARRGERLLDRLAVALEQVGRDVGAYEEILSCAVGSFLEEYYKGWGFEPTDLVMRRFIT